MAAATIRKNSKNPRVGNSIGVQRAASRGKEAIILGKANSLHIRRNLPIRFYRSARARASGGSAGCHAPPLPRLGMPRRLNLHRRRERLKILREGWIVGRSAVRGSGWFCGAVRLVGRVALLLCCIGALADISSAEEIANRPTIVVFGDSQGAGLARGLQRILIEDQRFRVLNRTHPGAALVHAEREWFGAIQNFVTHEQADIAIALFGATPRLYCKDDSGTTFRSP